MSFEKVSTILKMADEQNTSAIAFNCIDYNMCYGVIKGAEAVNKPVIIMLYPDHVTEMNIANTAEFVGMVRGIAERATIPVGLHLDHCSDYNFIVDAIRNGFTSVMIDGSMLPVEENIQITKKVVETAKIFGVAVEAELGHVGFAANSDQDKEDLYTTAEVAAAFCKETEVDSIAVAIGSAHGFYKETPKLDIERLKEINAATDTPLVLHGGSGIPNDQLELAFENGINKFNVGTEYFHLYYQSLKGYFDGAGSEGNVFDYHQEVQQILIDYVKEKLSISKF